MSKNKTAKHSGENPRALSESVLNILAPVDYQEKAREEDYINHLLIELQREAEEDEVSFIINY